MIFIELLKKQSFQLTRFDTAIFLRHTHIYVYIAACIYLYMPTQISICLYIHLPVYLGIQIYTYTPYIYVESMLIHVHTSKFSRKQIDLHDAYQMLGKHSHTFFYLLLYTSLVSFKLMCVLVAQSCPTLCNPMDCSPPAPPSMGFSKQEYWSGLPFQYREQVPLFQLMERWCPLVDNRKDHTFLSKIIFESFFSRFLFS